MTDALRDLTDFRLVIVTGKGGTGKTTVSCQLAEAARRAGKRVLLAETSPIESIAAYFERAPRSLGYKGRDLRKNLHALRLDPHEALADYVRVQFGLGALTDRILRLETFQQLLEAAPGWRELIILGKIWHLEQKRDPAGAHVYDLLIVDAPSTGHGLTFLDAPHVVQQALRSGPLARHASWVETLIHDHDRTLLLPVTTPEDLPVQETHELVRGVRGDLGILVDRIVVNRMPTGRTSEALDILEKIPEDLTLECLPSIPEMHSMLEHSAKRNQIAFQQRERVSNLCKLPVIDQPFFPGGFSADTGWANHAETILNAATWPLGDSTANTGELDQ